MNDAVFYEVNAEVDNSLTEAYERYMIEQHIPDVLATGRFTRAVISKNGDGRYRVSYEAKDRASLDAYLENDTASLREDFLEHFPTGIRLSREVWNEIKTLAPGSPHS